MGRQGRLFWFRAIFWNSQCVVMRALLRQVNTLVGAFTWWASGPPERVPPSNSWRIVYCRSCERVLHWNFQMFISYLRFSLSTAGFLPAGGEYWGPWRYLGGMAQNPHKEISTLRSFTTTMI